MAPATMGIRGVYRAEVEAKLPYRVFDVDNHIYPPADAELRFLGKRYVDRVFPEGHRHRTPVDVVGDEHKAKTLGEHTVGEHGGGNPLDIPEMKGPIPVPGAMLNRLNPMKGLSREEQEKLVQKFRDIEPSFENRDRRINVMDQQGVEAIIIHAPSHSYLGAVKRGDLEAAYAAARAWNRYLEEDWAFGYRNRIFTPAYIPFVDVNESMVELERCMKQGARTIGFSLGPAPGNRSPYDPYFDPLWSRINEAALPLAIHSGGNFAYRAAEWGEDPNAPYKDFNGFQWSAFWRDMPGMETVMAMVFHGFLTRYPKINVIIAEHGTTWVPWVLRKMDHGHLLGRKPKWGPKLPVRPSELFKTRFAIAPYPEENVQRAIDALGTDCLVFGSDFPHSEGLPDPVQYVVQLQCLPEPVIRKIMRDNLARVLHAN